MLLAKNYGSVPDEWCHDAMRHNTENDTVAIIYSYSWCNTIPSRKWMHDNEITNVNGLSIK